MKTIHVTAPLAIALSLTFAEPSSPDSTPQEPSIQEAETMESTLPTEFAFSVFTLTKMGLVTDNNPPAGFPNVYYDSPSGPALLTPGSIHHPELFRYEGDPQLDLYTLVREVLEPPEGSPPEKDTVIIYTRKPLIKLPLPTTTDRAMIILSPRQEGDETPIHIQVFPYHKDDIGEGSGRMYNLTEKDLMLSFPDQAESQHSIKAGESWDFVPTEVSDVVSPRVFIAEEREHGKPRGLHTNRVFLEPEGTNLFLIYSTGKRVNMVNVAKHIPADDERPSHNTP